MSTMSPFCSIGIGTTALVVGSKTALSRGPVPFTFQTYALLLLFFLNPKGSLLTVLLYLMLGGFGFAVFAGPPRTGIPVRGRTGGYLSGFLVTAYMIRGLNFIDMTVQQLFVSGLGIHVVILAMGGCQLASHIGARAAVENGVFPFLTAAVAKSAIAACSFIVIRSSNHLWSLGPPSSM
mmetsp:Transcript_31798/g.38443  ORF Transcript_31798/g.38443 Transcript_31798/m.38443 type:complete len:179 (-) Transcript_31798:471-1007(-)